MQRDRGDRIDCAEQRHRALALRRPHHTRLTEFYLWLAAGGAEVCNDVVLNPPDDAAAVAGIRFGLTGPSLRRCGGGYPPGGSTSR